jgi:hypothetical protein
MGWVACGPVPVEFLSDEQVASFGRFDGEPSRAELERFFYLDDADREVVGQHRGEHNRLGFAVQLGTVRYVGTFLSDPIDVPWVVVDYLAAQLGIEDASVVKRYSERFQTADDHAREIRGVYGLRDCAGPVVEELTQFVLSRAWTHGEGPTSLFEQATGWLRRNRVLLPGVSVLARLVTGAREQAVTGLYEHVAAATEVCDVELPEVLRGLLVADPDERATRLELLRRGPARVSGPALDKALGRVAEIRRLGVGGVDLSGVPASRVRVLARYGLEAKAQTLARLAEPRRTATLVATVTALESAAVDDAWTCSTF